VGWGRAEDTLVKVMEKTGRKPRDERRVIGEGGVEKRGETQRPRITGGNGDFFYTHGTKEKKEMKDHSEERGEKRPGARRGAIGYSVTHITERADDDTYGIEYEEKDRR